MIAGARLVKVAAQRSGTASRSSSMGNLSVRNYGRLISGRVSVPLGRSLLLGGVRHMGIGDTLTDLVTSKVDSGKEEKFLKMLTMMYSAPKWSLAQWKKTMDDQLDSWTMYMPGVSKSDEVKEVKAFKELLDKMTPAELDNPDLVNGQARLRIAVAAGKPVEDVSRLLFFYRQSLIVCTWLKMKQKAGEPMPTSESELTELQSSDSRMRTIAQKIMNPRGSKGRSGRGRKSPF
jgi:hypothetical protein